MLPLQIRYERVKVVDLTRLCHTLILRRVVSDILVFPTSHYDAQMAISFIDTYLISLCCFQIESQFLLVGVFIDVFGILVSMWDVGFENISTFSFDLFRLVTLMSMSYNLFCSGSIRNSPISIEWIEISLKSVDILLNKSLCHLKINR